MLVVLVGLLGLVAGFMSNISGGAGSLIMLPGMLALGVPPTMAIGTIKLGGFGVVLGGVHVSRQRKLIRKDHLKPLLAANILASLIGPQISLHLASHSVKIISSALVIATALFSLGTRKKSAEARHTSKKAHYLGYFLYFLSITLLAAFGSGVGLISTYILMGVIGMSALEAIGTRRTIGLAGGFLQVIPFVLTKNIDYGLGVAMLIGSIIGGYLGLRLAVKGGNEFVKKMMAISAIALVILAFV